MWNVAPTGQLGRSPQRHPLFKNHLFYTSNPFWIPIPRFYSSVVMGASQIPPSGSISLSDVPIRNPANILKSLSINLQLFEKDIESLFPINEVDLGKYATITRAYVRV